MRKRLTRRNRKRKNKIAVISSICLLLCLCVGYAAFSTNLNITAKGNVKEKSRVIQKRSWFSSDNFYSEFYKQNIVSATFLNNANVPSSATESWNVSEDTVHGGVMAWVIPNSEDSTKYDLYIGAKDGVIANEYSGYLFYDFPALVTINFNNNFDTSNTTNMDFMFASVYENSTSTYKPGSLKNINGLDSFNTSNVTSMRGMFRYTSEITNLNLSSFNTSNVTDMFTMFELSGVTSLDLSNFDTSNTTNMGWMFSCCKALSELNISNFNTSKVTSMNGMFSTTLKLTNLDLSNFDTSSVTSMSRMFQFSNILTLNLCGWNTNQVTDMTYLFSSTKLLNSISVGPNWTTDNADTTDMFTNSGVSSVKTGQC